LDEQRKTIVATLKALRLGQLTAEQAVAILKLAGIEPAQMLTELQSHVPAIPASTQNNVADDADDDERLTVLLSDGERVSRAVSVYEPPENMDSQPMSLEFPDDAPQSGISLDTRTLLSLEGAGNGGGGSGAAVRSRLVEGAGRYEIKREFARGGMGRILLSRDLDVGRDVALKELLPELAMGGTRMGTRMGSAGGNETNETGERFLREAKVTGQLEHPNIVPVYEIGERDDGNVYYTMKYVRGKTLAARLREIRKDDKLSDEKKNQERLKLLDPFVSMCNAVAFAHSRGVIHRDIKPENVMLGDFGETMLLDWGLARVKNQKDFAVKNKPKERNISDSLRESADASKTQDGYIIGTPAYMPPEQGRGEQEEVDEKSDIYSLGSVLYEILAGNPPYEGPTAGLVLQAMLTGAPAPLATKNKFAPRELIAVCEKAMAREKKDRFKSAMEISLQVQAFREGRNLSVYQYSASEQIKRYVKRHKATVTVIAIGLLLGLAGSIYAAGTLLNEVSLAQLARSDAENARDNAAMALDAAKREQQRERDLKQADLQRKERELRERAGAIRTLKKTVDGMRITSLKDDSLERLARYERAPEGQSLSPAERRENQVLLASLVGYISARENLLSLLSGASAEVVQEFAAGLDVPTESRELERLRIVAAKLAAYSGDFALSAYVLGGTSSPDLAQERLAVEETSRRLLASHKAEIEGVLAEVRAGLQRPGRSQTAPMLSDYVDQLSALRDRQTVELLAQALAPMQAKAEADSKEWSPQEFDVIKLVMRVLGRIDLPTEAVPVLAKFLPVIKEAELLVECGRALCNTRSPEAFEPLAEIGRYRFNYIWESIETEFALVPMPPSALKPATAAEFHKRSLARRARGDFDGAIDDCTRGLALDPNADLILIARAFARRAKGDYDGALVDFGAAIKLDTSQLARALVARGNCYKAMGEIDKSLADFSRSIDLDPRNPTPHIARGLARRDGGDLTGALSDFSTALDLDVRRAQTWTYRGEAKAYMGDPGGAFADYSKAIECDPEFAEAYTLRGILERQRGRFGESIRDLTRGAALNPKDPRNYAWRAQSDFGNDDLVGAINDCTHAIELDPRTWMAWYYRGITYLQLDQRRKKTESTETLDALAKTSALRSAVSDISKAHEVNPVDFLAPLILGEVYTRLGDRYAEIGDPAAAREAWQKAIDTLSQLKRENPYGANYYNDRLTLDEAVNGIAGARARLDAGSTPITAKEFLSRAHANAVLAADPAQDQKVALLRQSLADLAKARAMMSQAEASAAKATFATTLAAQMRALTAGGFFMDALSVFRELDAVEAAPGAIYDAACASARLASQFAEAGVLRVGEDDVKRGELEYQHNALTQAQRVTEASKLYDSAFALLLRAFEGGFGNFAQAQRDVDLTLLRGDSRWPDFAKKLQEIVKNKAAAGDPLLESVVVATAVALGSIAEKAGLLPLDVIWQVNGTRVTDLNSIKTALLMGRAGDSLVLTLRRYKFNQDGDFMPRLGADGKPLIDAQGNTQWEFEDRQVSIKRGTVKSLGLMAQGGVTGIGVGLVPAPPRP
jgi:serine/threonine protein kinase/lipoprotein NlpI